MGGRGGGVMEGQVAKDGRGSLSHIADVPVGIENPRRNGPTQPRRGGVPFRSRRVDTLWSLFQEQRRGLRTVARTETTGMRERERVGWHGETEGKGEGEREG